MCREWRPDDAIRRCQAPPSRGRNAPQVATERAWALVRPLRFAGEVSSRPRRKMGRSANGCLDQHAPGGPCRCGRPDMIPLTSALLHALEALRPASGILPATDAEWCELEDDARASLAAVFRERGASEGLAIAAADKTMGAPAGRLILHLAYSPVRRADPSVDDDANRNQSSDLDHGGRIAASTSTPSFHPSDDGGAR